MGNNNKIRNFINILKLKFDTGKCTMISQSC